LSGEKKARIVVVTAATDLPDEYGRDYISVFRRLGVRNVTVVDVSLREDAEPGKGSEGIAAINRATGIFFTGGDQLHITSLLGGTTMEDAICRRWQKGVVLGGTSAGAAMMSGTMFIGGASSKTP